ncbi:capsular polysaccharide transport system permease protein [Yoonia tamlensis]|uniref:Capsular polysaccharide transport system permease protein n=2 Tax=Yoonia tamlensis TaxID=390270 RepID=A0A1I6GL46_9RHOB|nr:capsular polysaccharide transport system permease protein [Yoonia tamlensis]
MSKIKNMPAMSEQTPTAQTDRERSLSLVTAKTHDLQVVAPPSEPRPPQPAYQSYAPKARRWPYFLSFVMVVILPAFSAWWYLTEIASDRFTSEFRVAVRSTQAPAINGMGSMLGLAGGGGASSDAQALVQYLQSHAIVSDPLNDIDLAAIYSAPDIDWASRLVAAPTTEELLKTWKRYVAITFESGNVTVVGQVTAFDPDDAYLISTALVTRADEFINRLSEVARLDALAFARREVAQAETALTNARRAVADLQDQESIVNPARNIEEAQSLAAGLRDRIAQSRALLATQRSQLASDAPSIRATERDILGLQEELDRVERLTITQTDEADTQQEDRPLSTLVREFSEATNTLDYAQRAYESALTTFEAARIEADRKQIYLASVVAPSLPQQASFPKPVEGTMLVAAVSLALWLLGLIGVFAIKDHM